MRAVAPRRPERVARLGCPAGGLRLPCLRRRLLLRGREGPARPGAVPGAALAVAWPRPSDAGQEA